jgi:hypothetical protein
MFSSSKNVKNQSPITMTQLDTMQKHARYNTSNYHENVESFNLDKGVDSIDYSKKASTPLASSSRTVTNVFKLTPHKQSNHSRLKCQTSPYYHHNGKLNSNNNANNNNNNSSCSSSVSNSSHSFLHALNTSLNTSSTDESQNLSTKTNPPTTPVQFQDSSDSSSPSNLARKRVNDSGLGKFIEKKVSY